MGANTGQGRIKTMADLLKFEDGKRLREQKCDEVFARYCELARKAQATLDIRDAVEAGKAWGEWVRLFERVS